MEAIEKPALEDASQLAGDFDLSLGTVTTSLPANSDLPSTVNGLPARCVWREGIRVGSFRKPSTGQLIEVQPDRLNRWSAALSRMKQKGRKVYVCVDHSSKADDNRGEIIDHRIRDGRLEVKMQLVGEDAFKNNARCEISPRIVPKYIESDGEDYGECFEHFSFVSNPVIHGQQAALAASRGEQDGSSAGTNAGAYLIIPATTDFSKGADMACTPEQMAMVKQHLTEAGKPGEAEMVTPENAMDKMLAHHASMRTKHDFSRDPIPVAKVTELETKLASAETAKATAETKVADLSRQIPTPLDPKDAKERAGNKLEKIDILLSRGDVTPFIAEKLRKAVTKDGTKIADPVGFSLSRSDELGDSPIDFMLSMFDGAKLAPATGERKVADLSREQKDADAAAEAAKKTPPKEGAAARKYINGKYGARVKATA